MPLSITRRQALCALGGLAALAEIRPFGSVTGPRRVSRCDETIGELAAALRSAPRSRAFEIAADAIRGGATIETLLGAVLRIGVEDIRPRPHGILHAVMMVHSSFALADGASEEQAWLAVLWNLDDLKTAQQRDRDEDGDWSMPPRQAVRVSSAEAARAELLAAMNAWDPDRADGAVVALLPHVDHDAFFELIWPLAARCNAFIGHKIIYAAQMERALRRISWSQSEPAARSLVRTLLVNRETDTWEANSHHATKLSEKRAPNEADPERARELYRRLRTAGTGEAIPITLDALEDGVSAGDVWDALRLVASEVFHCRSGRRSNTGRNALLPVHALTVVNALGHAARTTTDVTLSWRCLLEAVVRMPAMRDWLVASTDLATDAPPLETLAQGVDQAPTDLDVALESGSPGLVCAHLSLGATSVSRYGTRMRASLLRTAREHHQHKYAAAMLEEGMRAHPAVRPLILAPAVDYLANPADGTTDVHERSLAALRRAGLR